MDTPGPQAHEEPTHLWPSGKVFRDDHHTPVRNSNVDLMEPGEGTSLLRKISTRCSSTHCDRWLTGPCVSNSTIRLLLDTEHYEDWPLKSAARSVTWFTNLDDIHKVTRESSGSPLRAWQAYHHAILSSFLAEVIAKVDHRKAVFNEIHFISTSRMGPWREESPTWGPTWQM